MNKYKFKRYTFYLSAAILVIAAIFYINSKQKKPIKSIDGAELFNRNCASCHRLDKEFTGPILKGALKRWGYDKKAMYAFVRNSAEMVEKNKYAQEVFKKYNKVRMTAFLMSDAELDAIFKYCDP